MVLSRAVIATNMSVCLGSHACTSLRPASRCGNIHIGASHMTNNVFRYLWLTGLLGLLGLFNPALYGLFGLFGLWGFQAKRQP